MAAAKAERCSGPVKGGAAEELGAPMIGQQRGTNSAKSGCSQGHGQCSYAAGAVEEQQSDSSNEGTGSGISTTHSAATALQRQHTQQRQHSNTAARTLMRTPDENSDRGLDDATEEEAVAGMGYFMTGQQVHARVDKASSWWLGIRTTKLLYE